MELYEYSMKGNVYQFANMLNENMPRLEVQDVKKSLH